MRLRPLCQVASNFHGSAAARLLNFSQSYVHHSLPIVSVTMGIPWTLNATPHVLHLSSHRRRNPIQALFTALVGCPKYHAQILNL